MNKEFVVIITLNYNQNDFTLKCVDSVLKSDYGNFVLLVIDNGSTTQNKKELLRVLPKNNHLFFKEIENNIGYVGGINFGLKEGEKLNPDYFLIMNNDTIIDKNSIKELVKTCDHYNDRAIVTGKVYEYDEPNKFQDIGYYYKDKKRLIIERLGLFELDHGQYDRIEERDMLDDMFWLFSSKLFKEIGGYSPYFWFNSEQADFAMRAKKIGYKLVYTPFAKLWHKGSVSIGGSDMNPKLAFWTIQSSLILRYIHLNRIRFTSFYFRTLWSILRTFIKSIYVYLAKGEDIFKYAYAKYKGLVYFNKWVFKKNINSGFNPFS